MPSFRLPSSIWKIPVSWVSRTRTPCWRLCFVWLRLRREKWEKDACVLTVVESYYFCSRGLVFTRCPRIPFQVSSWRPLCLGGHLLRQGGNSLSARVVHVYSCNRLKGSGPAPAVLDPPLHYRAVLQCWSRFKSWQSYWMTRQSWEVRAPPAQAQFDWFWERKENYQLLTVKNKNKSDQIKDTRSMQE